MGLPAMCLKGRAKQPKEIDLHIRGNKKQHTFRLLPLHQAAQQLPYRKRRELGLGSARIRKLADARSLSSELLLKVAATQWTYGRGGGTVRV
jgi:hypothetical protein